VTKARAGEPSSGSSPSKSGIASIGVVTFNGDQQRLIENQARRSDPSLEAHFDRVATMSYEETPRVGVDPKQ
jgi:hypothetical protein